MLHAPSADSPRRETGKEVGVGVPWARKGSRRQDAPTRIMVPGTKMILCERGRGGEWPPEFQANKQPWLPLDVPALRAPNGCSPTIITWGRRTSPSSPGKSQNHER